jgi:hypothetical protein
VEHLFVSDLIRHWKPAPNFSFRDSAQLVLAADSSNAFMVNRSAPRPETKTPAIEWFSAFCDAFFSRWAYPLIIALPGIAFLIVGGLLIALHFSPPSMDQVARS